MRPSRQQDDARIAAYEAMTTLTPVRHRIDSMYRAWSDQEAALIRNVADIFGAAHRSMEWEDLVEFLRDYYFGSTWIPCRLFAQALGRPMASIQEIEAVLGPLETCGVCESCGDIITLTSRWDAFTTQDLSGSVCPGCARKAVA